VDRVAARLIIKGRVQGVGYRWWAQGQAKALGLDGWVRNLRDGTVELLAAGPEEAIGRLIEACRQGPPAAAVQSVERLEADGEGLDGFEERPTA
jgi:acylphosphatase